MEWFQYAALGYNLWSLCRNARRHLENHGVPGMVQYAMLGFVVLVSQSKMVIW